MDHTPAEKINWTPAGIEHFTGNVWLGQLSKVPDPGLDALGVLFAPGARTDWHTHPDGQVLYIAAGAKYGKKVERSTRWAERYFASHDAKAVNAKRALNATAAKKLRKAVNKKKRVLVRYAKRTTMPRCHVA